MRQIRPGSPRRRLTTPWRGSVRNPQIPGACCSLAAKAGSPGTREWLLLHSANPRAPASDREVGERAGGRGTQLRGKGVEPGRGEGGIAEQTSRREGGRGHPRRGWGGCRGAGVRGSAPHPPDPRLAGAHSPDPRRKWRPHPPAPAAPSPSPRCPSSVPPPAPGRERRSGRRLHRPGGSRRCTRSPRHSERLAGGPALPSDSTPASGSPGRRPSAPLCLRPAELRVAGTWAGLRRYRGAGRGAGPEPCGYVR